MEKIKTNSNINFQLKFLSFDLHLSRLQQLDRYFLPLKQFSRLTSEIILTVWIEISSSDRKYKNRSKFRFWAW